MIRTILVLGFYFTLTGFYAQTVPPAYQTDIAPIVYSKCSPCHRPGSIGPMPFTRYEEVAAYARMIAYVTEARYMPPWPADPTYRHFSGEVVLSDSEVDLIRQWVQAGMPEGKADQTTYQPPLETAISNPDLQIGMAESFEQYGIYYDQFQTFVLPTNLSEDKQVTAIEFVPGNARIVRHCRVAIDRGEAATKEDVWDPRYGYFSYGGWGFVPEFSEWFSWAAGESATFFPAGLGKHLPAGAKLIVQVHYGPTGVKQRDSSYFNLKFADHPLDQELQTIALLNPYTLKNPPFVIPAGAIKRFFSSVTLPVGIQLYNLTPHSLLLAKTWEIYAKLPGEREPVKLLKVKDWDYKWKRTYRLPSPVYLPKGTTIHALVEYDNTANNPYNPVSPPIEVSWGKRVYQEMLLVHFGFTTSNTKPHLNTSFRLSTLANNLTDSKLEFNLTTLSAAVYSVRLYSTANSATMPQLVHQQRYEKGTHKVSIPLSQVPFGVYALEIRNDRTGEIFKKIIVSFGEETL